MSATAIATFTFYGKQITMYFGTLILIAGVIGGFLNIIVFLSLKTFRQSSCAFYLTTMSAFNIGQMLIGLLGLVMFNGFDIDWSQSPLFYCKFRFYCFQVCALTSMTCICLAIIDQYFATCSRLQWQQWSNIKLARLLLTIFIIIWILHNIPYLIYFDYTISITTGKVICTVSNNIFQLYVTYGIILILGKLLPVGITLFFGILAYRNVKQLAHRTLPFVRRELDKQLTVMVLVQVVFAFFTIMPYAIVYILLSIPELSQDSLMKAELQLASAVTLLILTKQCYQFTVSIIRTTTAAAATTVQQCRNRRHHQQADQMQWLSRPNLRLVTERLSSNLCDLERFRISFNVTGFKQENIKITIENRVLIISGVHEEGSRESGSYSQKQFEKRYELPSNVDLKSMASYVNTKQQQLIVEIPLIQNQQQMKKLSNDIQEQRLTFAINKPDEHWEKIQQKSLSTSTKTSSTQDSTSNNVMINIPRELLQSGKTLTIEKHSEEVVSGHKVSQPTHPIPQTHGLCLVDKQKQEVKSSTDVHQLQENIGNSEVVQIKIEVPPEALQNGKTITIQKSSKTGSTTTGSNQKQQPSGNFVDLYTDKHTSESTGKNNVHIEIPEQFIEKGETILIQRENVSVTKTSDYCKQQAQHVVNNQFNKWDHLQSKNMMELTIQVSPKLLNSGQVITLQREDLQSTAANCHQHNSHNTNQYQSELQQTNYDKSKSAGMMSMEEFLLNKTWNPSLSNNGRLLHMRLDFTNQPSIVKGDQLKITLNGSDFRVETTDQQGCTAYRQVTLFKSANLAELKCHFDEARRCLDISVPLQ
ncbi:hypothetical protein I4U23_031356 [Adineta vaga]|nr:hypothetical protein I4U23_031356 [Adineta vaga]